MVWRRFVVAADKRGLSSPSPACRGGVGEGVHPRVRQPLPHAIALRAMARDLPRKRGR